MSETSKIKDSFTKRKYSESFGSENSFEKSTKCSLFIPICFAIFLFHWIILCPLVFGMLYKTIYSSGWPIYWPQLFWTVALFLYIIIMIIFMILWRRRKIQKQKLNRQYSETIVLENKRIKTLDSIEEECEYVTLRGPHREQQKLEPLVIDDKMTDDSKNIFTDEKIEERGENLSKVSAEINRSSIKEYLKIVTVETPSPSGERTCGTPMTPRDVFFIDLIKNAERAEEKGKVTNVFRYEMNDKDDDEKSGELKPGKRCLSEEKDDDDDEDEEMQIIDEKNEKLIEIKNLKIVSTQKKLIDKKFKPFDGLKMPNIDGQKKSKEDEKIVQRTSTNLTEEEILRKKNIDIRRYTMGSAEFKHLLGAPNTRGLSKSETTLPQIFEQKEVKEEAKKIN